MKNNSKKVLSTLLITLVFTISGIYAQTSFNTQTFDKEMELMKSKIGIPGFSVAIIENNQVVYSNEYGWSHVRKKKKVTSKTLFEAASMTKLFLVYIVNRLVDEGKLDLNKQASYYLPYKRLQHDIKRYKNITIGMLLSHTAGLENWKAENDPEKLEFVKEPGTAFAYSGEGYAYLADIVSKIVGASYDEYVEEMTIEPWDLENTFLKYKSGFLQNKVKRNHAMGYTTYGTEYEGLLNKKSIPASGAHMTAHDLGELIIHTLSGKHYSKKQQDLILTPKAKLDFAPGTSELKFDIGLGVFLLTTEDDTIAFFSGVNTGFRSEFFYSPKEKKGFVFMSNSDDGWMMVSKIDELTSKFNLRRVFKDDQLLQYPSDFFNIRDMYRRKGSEELFASLNELKSNNELNQDAFMLFTKWLKDFDKQTYDTLLEEFGKK